MDFFHFCAKMEFLIGIEIGFDMICYLSHAQILYIYIYISA